MNDQSLAAPVHAPLSPARGRSPRLPRALPEPAVIGVCAPSGRVDEEALRQGVAYLEDLGHRVVVAPECARAWRYFAGCDDERLQGFHALVDDPSVDLIIAARGGYGMSRLLHRIDWAKVAASSKLFAGFSDFTAFNMAALACANLVTFHAPMVASDFGRPDVDTFSEQHFWLAISQATHRIDGIVAEHGYDPRRIDGTLWGGNLSLIAHLAGTPYFPAIGDGILYCEEVGEQPYAIERNFLQLYHAGILARQKAVVLGSFHACDPTNTARYPYAIEEVVEYLRQLLPIPVLTGLPFGHIPRKVTLPFGAPGTLDISDSGFSLRFSGHLQDRGQTT